MIFGKPACNDSDNESTVVAYSNTFLFRRVDISGTDNQCIMNSLNAFYKDVDDSRKANILWNVVNQSNNPHIRCNDNAFVLNRMVGYDTTFYGVCIKHQYWDEINPRAATCYIKFGAAHFEYIQPLRPDNDDVSVIKDDEMIIPIGKRFFISSSFGGYC